MARKNPFEDLLSRNNDENKEYLESGQTPVKKTVERTKKAEEAERKAEEKKPVKAAAKKAAPAKAAPKKPAKVTTKKTASKTAKTASGKTTKTAPKRSAVAAKASATSQDKTPVKPAVTQAKSKAAAKPASSQAPVFKKRTKETRNIRKFILITPANDEWLRKTAEAAEISVNELFNQMIEKERGLL